MANILDGFDAELISLDDINLITSSVDDPSAGAGEAAPTGSLLLRSYNSGNDGDLYIKHGPLDADWDVFVRESILDNRFTPIEINITDLDSRVNNLIQANGFNNVDGSFNSLPFNTNLSNVSVNPSDNLIEVLSQLDSAITTAAGVDSIPELIDTDINSPQDSQALVYNATSSKWENVTIAVPPPGGGRIVQVEFGPIPSLSGTAQIPLDSSPPLSTEGVELWSFTIVPTETTSTIRIASSMVFTGSSNSLSLIAAVFADGFCIGSVTSTGSKNNTGQTLTFTIYDQPSTTLPVTYSVRVGKESGVAGTWYINNIPGIPNTLGGTMQNNAYTIEEIGNA